MAKRASFIIPNKHKNRPSVPDVIPLVKAIYAKPGGGAGCCLHVVLDDGNLKDCHIEEVITSARHHLCHTVALLMSQMTGTQRRILSKRC